MQMLEDRRTKMHQGLDELSVGVKRLKGYAEAIGQQLEEQNKLIDQQNKKADRVNSNVVTLNKKLHKTLTEVRTTEKICVHAILIFILLGLLSYMWQMFTS
eukprot:c7137_g1_i1.p1 GENE.c7137_g1_i1~~c7137_g1_i1.p1  ORF type:complete len:101 (+),score=29.50 c7137_g1_i1:736-1038(+)